jgi:hypothetical protein
MTTGFNQNSIHLSRYFYLEFTVFITTLFSATGYILNGMGVLVCLNGVWGLWISNVVLHSTSGQY